MGTNHVICILLMTSAARAAWDTSFCQDNAQGATNLPNLPSSFSMRVEVNIKNKNQTTALHEYYNSDANIAAVRQIIDGTEQYFFYYYGTNQLLQVQPDKNGGRTCFGQDLSQNQNQNMFGISKVNSSTDRIYSVYGALHFGGHIKQKYLGQETIRGIPCNKWRSCQYWDDMDATSNVTWYFSDETVWSSLSGYPAPVRCLVNGRRWNATTNTYYTYDHVYEFFDFQSPMPPKDQHFDVPSNTFCFAEMNRKPLPTMPYAYSFNAELVNVKDSTIKFIKELYDNNTHLMRYDYRSPPQDSSPFGTRYVSQIHDYNMGVRYIIDVLRATCQATVIPENDFDNVVVDANDVRMRNPKEFLDLNHNYAYQGVRTARNIECDTWSTMRFDYPDPTSQQNPATIWTWYFATANWMQSMGYRDNLVAPIMLEIYSDTPGKEMHYIMNIYEYNAEEPDLMNFDISVCYSPSQSRNIAFLVPGRYTDLVANDARLFKYFVLMSIQAYTDVSPLRITRLDIQEADSNVLVTFDLLDKAPLAGDVLNPPKEPSLDGAYTLLTSLINKGSFQILMQSGTATDLRKLTAKPAPSMYQFRSTSRARRAVANPASTSGFSAGAMGGMAVGMLVLGALVGFAIMAGVYRARGGTFAGAGGIGMRRFQNDQEPAVKPESTDA